MAGGKNVGVEWQGRKQGDTFLCPFACPRLPASGSDCGSAMLVRVQMGWGVDWGEHSRLTLQEGEGG